MMKTEATSLIVAFLFNDSFHNLVSAFGSSPYCDLE